MSSGTFFGLVAILLSLFVFSLVLNTVTPTEDTALLFKLINAGIPVVVSFIIIIIGLRAIDRND